jgi:hypothetical protein
MLQRCFEKMEWKEIRGSQSSGPLWLPTKVHSGGQAEHLEGETVSLLDLPEHFSFNMVMNTQVLV